MKLYTDSAGDWLEEEDVYDVIVDCKITKRYEGMDILRELAKRPEMQFLWSVANGTNTAIFAGPVSSWNFLQKRFVYWLTFYHNVGGAHDRPPNRILMNNRLCDEWLSTKSKEMDDEYEKNWRKSVNKVSKTAYEHDEVYEL